MRKYQKKRINALIKVYHELCHDLVCAFHPDAQEGMIAELLESISTDCFTAKHNHLISKYERIANPAWQSNTGQTVATKLHSFWQKLDENDAEFYIDFMNEAVDSVSQICKTCQRC